MRIAISSGRAALAVTLAFGALVAAGSVLRVRPAAAQDTGEPRYAGDAKCALCHGEVADAFPSTGHGRITGRAHLCEDCHGPGEDHVGTAGNKGKIRSFRTAPPAEVNDTCLSCHGKDATGHAPRFRGSAWEARGMTCLSCHGVHIAAGEAPPPPVRERPAATTATCLVCHADPVYGARFGHRSLEAAAPACASCHGGGEAHVDAPGTAGLVTGPRTLSTEAERALCLSCHGEFTPAKHFPDRRSGTRCGDCHDLHRDGGSARRATVELPPGLEPGHDPFRRDGPGKAFFRGRFRAGGRVVSGDEGRYAEDVTLRSGGRLFLLEAEAGVDDGDPSAVRGSLDVTGAGDPSEHARLEARAGDLWSVEVRRTRTELPFLGGGGVHPGETERERWSTTAEMKAGDGVRVSAGHDRLDTRGELEGRVLDAGAIVPVVMRLDRTATEDWASVGVRGGTWHFTFRQAWRGEEGDDDRNLPDYAGLGPERLSYEDDSSLRGPVTGLVAGAEVADGLEVELRATLAALDRRVHVRERRRGLLGGSPFSRDAVTDGDRDQRGTALALDVDWTVAEHWAVEASLERRTLREDGDLRTDETITTTAGTTSTTSLGSDGYGQELRTATLGGRWVPRRGLRVRAGLEHETDALREGGGGDTLRSRGGYAGLDADIDDRTSAELALRTLDGRGAFTSLTAQDRDEASIKLRHRRPDGVHGALAWRRTRWTAGESGLGSEGDAASAGVGYASPKDLTVDFTATWNRLDLAVDRLAFPGPGIGAADSTSLVRSLVLDVGIGVPLGDRLRVEAAVTRATDRGDLPVRALDTRVALRYDWQQNLALGLTLRRRTYDARTDRLDYRANLLEAWIEIEF